MLERARQTLRELRPAAPRGPFPSAAWAWPSGDRDLLLQAAILDDLDDAIAAYRRWQQSFDFNDVDGARHRLLLAIAARLPAERLGAVDQARLTGVERQFWARSMVGMQAAKPLLAAFADAGIAMLVFKGAAGGALDYGNLRGRHAADIDLLVRPREFDRAWDIAMAQGWRKAKPEHVPERMIGTNLVAAGGVGELDLHKYPFHQLLRSDNDERGIWERASRHPFLEQQVFVPSPTDRLVLAIAHGGIGSHDQSDWLVDAARLIQSGAVDWPLFLDLVAERQLDIFASIALGYLAGPMRLTVPADVLDTVARRARTTPVQRVLGLLEARPRADHWVGSSLGRTLARRLRLRRRRRMLALLEPERRSAV